MTTAENIIYKKDKWVKIAIIGLGCLIVIISVKNTVTLIFRFLEVRQNLSSIENSAPNVGHKYPDEFFEEVDVNQVIFEAIGESAKIHGVIVKKINTPFVVKENEYLILTEEITLEGNFVNIMKCVDEADEKLGFIKIASLKFEKEESSRSNILLLKVHFQMITENNEKIN